MINNQPLIKHIENILSLVFDKTSETVKIYIYDSTNINPLYTGIILETIFDLFIVIEFNNKIPNIKEKNKKLSKLLSKKVNVIEDDNYTKIYWFEGLLEIIQQEVHSGELKTIQLINKLKSETRLPNWLDKFIFEKLNAKYEPDFEKFDYNLEHIKDELLIYLGTYFPRSFSECFCIFDDLFANSFVKSKFKNKSEINILDIGCGTGGNLIGLLSSYNKNFTDCLTANIWAIDGNHEALEILVQIIEKFKQYSNIKINLYLISEKFTNIDELQRIVQIIPCQSFDIIMSFKTICEIILKGKGLYNQSYYKVAELACQILENEGLFLLLDVTSKTPFTNFLPIHLNEQIRNFTKQNKDFKILSPLSCNFNSSVCDNQCFYQYDFFVSHKQRHNDVSRVAYKIIGRKVFVENVCKEIKVGKFVINWKQFNNEIKNYGCCMNSVDTQDYFDAFKISEI